MTEWQSDIVGERMVVDGEFTDRVADASLTTQQWSLVMTAVRFEIEDPASPEDARLVADTSNLDTMLPEIKKIANQGPTTQSDTSSKSVLGNIFSNLPFGGPSDDDIRDEAVELADEYAEHLQAKLVERGRWDDVRERASSG